MNITIPIEIAPGELLDKISILEIKLERITDPFKLENINTEWKAMVIARDKSIRNSQELTFLCAELKRVNEELWIIEDNIRACEHNFDFGEKFVGLARSVYKTNDERARIKRCINELLGSPLVEEKSYTTY